MRSRISRVRARGVWRIFLKFWWMEPILGNFGQFWWYRDFKIWEMFVCPILINFEKIQKMISMQNWILRYSTVRNFDFTWFLIQFWHFCDYGVKNLKFLVSRLRISKFGFQIITNLIDFTKFFVDFVDFNNKNDKFFSEI